MRGTILVLMFLSLMARSDAGLRMAAEETIAEDLVLVSAEFGLVEKGDDGSVQFKATDKVPLVTGQGYGWRMRFRTKRESVALREELELPVAPKTWDHSGEGGDFKVSADGRTGITEADAVLQDGAIIQAWQVADGDPTGAHVIRVYIDGKLARTFKFDVVAP